MTVIDKDGSIFNVTPSGGWIPGAVILGDTGIGMSVRGEQFWLDPTRAAQIRPRARPRYTLTPSIVFKGDVPMVGIGTPGGDNQDQTILQAFLSVVEFWNDWYPNLHAAFDVPRVSRRCTSTDHSRRTPRVSTNSTLRPRSPIPSTTNLKPAATTSAGCARSACPAAQPR